MIAPHLFPFHAKVVADGGFGVDKGDMFLEGLLLLVVVVLWVKQKGPQNLCTTALMRLFDVLMYVLLGGLRIVIVMLFVCF